MSETKLFSEACDAATKFPANTVRSSTSWHQLDSYYIRLHEQRERIFCADEKASLDIYDYTTAGFRMACLSSASEVKGHLIPKTTPFQRDPCCRFVFIHAPSSRQRLRISQDMLSILFTHHQVMPTFLDFIFPFGYQHYAEDFHFSGFREDTRLLPIDGGLCLPELGRSGRELRMCYNLKSVEPLPGKSDEDWPWRVRQTSLYHSFDLINGNAFWTIVKGSTLIRDRIQALTKSPASSTARLSSFNSISDSLTSALATHLVLCDWCAEDWRWYIAFLDKRLQKLTRRALTVDIIKAQPLQKPSTFQVLKPTSSLRRDMTALTKRTARTITFRSQRVTSSTQFTSTFPMPQVSQTPSNPLMPKRPPVLPPGRGGPPSKNLEESDEIFSERTLQRVQEVEDKSNEVCLALEANIKILGNIRDHYRSVLESEDCPFAIRKDYRLHFSLFEKRVGNIIGDLEIQNSSAQTLLRVISNRKDLLSGLLNLRNIEASKELANKSQYADTKMMEMTEAMHQLAVKTKEETVSMRVITLVTLFFLPGTFISTIMSTDIIQFPSSQDSGKVFQIGALQLYFAITIPLMVLTFASWVIVYWWVNKRQDFKAFGGGFLGWRS